MTAKSTDPSATRTNWNERAERWRLRQAERSEVYGPATELMLDLAGVQTSNRVLDVACGMGDQTLFVSTKEVKEMWRFIDPIIEVWNKNSVPLESYKPDTNDAPNSR